jgi:hypothetical protein
MAHPAKKMNRVNLFKTFTLKWWQAALFKGGILTLGIAIGSYWYQFFGQGLPALLLVAGVFLSYVTYAWWKQ